MNPWVKVALFVLAGPLTAAIYHYGNYRDSDVRMTQFALMAFSLALLGWTTGFTTTDAFVAAYLCRAGARPQVYG